MKNFLKVVIPLFLIFLVIYIIIERNDLKQRENVLGVHSEKGEESRIIGEVKKTNPFPLDMPYASGFTPVRKDSFYGIKIWAGSSVAVDANSGTILHYDKGRKKTQIASLTKIMTALLTVEKIKNLKDEVVAITKGAAYIPGTVVGCPRTGYCLSNRLYTGEKVSAYNLLKAMLINSANDAAYSLGVHIAGNEKKFAEMMNDKARSLGLKDTHFCTASGLEIDGQENQCYSSAYDIARIGIEALKYDIIWEIMRIPEDQFYSMDGKYMHELKNTDILLSQLSNCIGGKTGFTPLAGKSLLFAGTDPTGKHQVVMVILNDPKRFEDMKFLNSWIFENYEWK
jgi:D-alanyl-D-alanine carboxypeptidase